VAGYADGGRRRGRIELPDPLHRDAGRLERADVAVVHDGERVTGAEVAAPDAGGDGRPKAGSRRGRHDPGIGVREPRL
jgi:hypothetical protein